MISDWAFHLELERRQPRTVKGHAYKGTNTYKNNEKRSWTEVLHNDVYDVFVFRTELQKWAHKWHVGRRLVPLRAKVLSHAPSVCMHYKNRGPAYYQIKAENVNPYTKIVPSQRNIDNLSPSASTWISHRYGGPGLTLKF